MELKHTFLPMGLLAQNKGQIEGLPTNPRQWSKSELEKLKSSIKETPELLEARGLIVYPRAGKYIILGGNMRYTALKELGVEQAPCVVLPEELPQAKLKEIVIKDNGSFGEWDFDLLANEWDELPLDNWGVPAWDTAEEESEEQVAVKEDDFDESVEVAPRVCRGEVWLLGNHRLMCGDSTSQADVATLMGGEMADLLLTDPPYNVAYEGGTEDKLTIKNDSMSDAAFAAFLKSAFAASNEVMKPGAAFYIWHADSEGYNFRTACREVEWKHEPCLYGWKDGAPHNWYSDRKQTTVIDFDRPTRNGEHPTMKPVGLFAYLMKNSSAKNDIVLDAFAGSGTTIIAAEQLERRARCMELDAHYCDVIITRWETLTGLTAKKVE